MTFVSGLYFQFHIVCGRCNYLHQVNGVNGGDNTVFVLYVSVCVSVRSGLVCQFKTVKATDFKFDMHVPRDSPDMTS